MVETSTAADTWLQNTSFLLIDMFFWGCKVSGKTHAVWPFPWISLSNHSHSFVMCIKPQLFPLRQVRHRFVPSGSLKAQKGCVPCKLTGTDQIPYSKKLLLLLSPFFFFFFASMYHLLQRQGISICVTFYSYEISWWAGQTGWKADFMFWRAPVTWFC